MSNGSNDFGVTFAQISWLSRLLRAHENVANVTRCNDIQFDLGRRHGPPVRLVCLDEYTCGLARVLEVQEAFPGVNLVYVGGAWNHYTGAAKEHCVGSEIGLFNTTEMTGALHRDDFWNYVKRDKG